MSDAVERILEAVAALSDRERQELFERLGSEGTATPASQPALSLRFSAGEMEGDADCFLVFDGGSQGNPGPGYGSYVLACGGEEADIVRLDFGREMTNNEAEYETLIASLQALVERIEAAGATPADWSVEVRGDSALVIHQVRGTWKTKDDRMRALRNQGRQLLARFKAYRLVHQRREESLRTLGH